MRAKFIIFDKKLRGKSPLSFLGIMSLALYLPVIILLLLPSETNTFSVSGFPKGTIAFAVLFVAPFLETIIFQALVLNITRKIFKINNDTSILISAGLFGLVHYSSFSFQVNAFLCGLILAYSYIVLEKMYENKQVHTIIMVSIMHSLRNIPGLIAVMLGYNY